MKGIKVISASAGSGKTYRLASELRDAIVDRGVRPEAVVVTTFTVKAAAELQERVRARLIEDGKAEEAARLLAARIGTVHSVCHGLLRDFAFELEISPEVDVQDTTEDDGLDPLLARALTEVLSPRDVALLDGLAERFEWKNDPPWEGDVQKIITLARSNAIPADELSESKARSKASLVALLGPPARSGKILERRLQRAMETYLTEPLLVESSFKKDIKTADLIRKILARMDGGGRLTWPEWNRYLTKLQASSKLVDAFVPVQEALAAHDTHPGLRADLESYVDTVFDLAARAMRSYQRRKQEAGVVDYADMEALAFQLLSRDDVQQRLSEELELVLVDEFQDTNPIQLAIFLKLAQCAGVSVWVGDQKQSIYRFRGADPALMEAALRGIAGDREPESLPYSYRSRPDLVDLVSEVFTPAFGAQGIPAERVRLQTPPDRDYPDDLGPPVELWNLVNEAGEPVDKADLFNSLASGVQALLNDPTVRVRDPATMTSRPVEPRDIGILPFYRASCGDAATALERVGISAAVARDSLMTTAEGRYMLAALTLWAAPGDTVAAATLARFLDHPEDQNGFLARGLGNARSEAYADQPVVQAIRDLAAGDGWLGLLDAFDRLCIVSGVRETCRRWGDSVTRLANLEAFRGYVAAYADGADSGSRAPTPAGLIAWLGENATDEALPATANAVTVVNWHRAKGLEWPITILLFASRRPRLKDIFGVDIATDQRADDLDLSDPLGGRWIRCWLYPYGSAYKDIPMWDRLGDNPDARQRLEQLQREEVRHLYVTFTRARDRLVLVQTSEELIEGASLELLNPSAAAADDGDPVVGELDGDSFDWAGLTLPMVTRICPPAEDLERVVEADFGYAPGQPDEPGDLAPAYVQPSALDGAEPDNSATEVLAPEVLGDPLAITGKPVWNNLGLALHAFIAADRPSLTAKDRRTIAERLLEGWEVADHLSEQDLLTASERLRTWIGKNYPDARWHHEAPVRHRLQSGSIVRGEADLILELPDRFVVIDHKTFRPNGKSLADRQFGYAAQLGAYRDALVAASASGITTIDTFVHYPLLGQIGRLRP